ncbi:N-acetylneuraminate synthase family protein [Sporosarcina koreensis]|uniref:N-acetylneuraminate synthase family protein n=1 Tax=Sporosarcina koreensis TaxID=334735 RepID=UPI000751D5D5|nr:N-acetylneuraminate synthase family protein [Sporosarcina koreensis]
MNKVKIIAEIANAHQGDFKQLIELIEKSKSTGADAIKFQWFKYDSLSTPDYEWHEIYKTLFFNEGQWIEVLKYCKELDIEVWVDVFDEWGIEMARKMQSLYHGIKLPSTIIQSKAILESILSIKKPLLIGIGGWNNEELEGLFLKIKDYEEEVIYLHGFQGYPTKTEDSNIIRITEMKNKYNLRVGYADHEDASKQTAINIPVYAYFAGAEVIEKHITLDRSLKGYDYYSSLEPEEFKEMVKAIEDAQIISGTLVIGEAERNYLSGALRAVAKTDIKKGQYVSLENVTYKRCSDSEALMPNEFEENIAYIASKDIKANEPINPKYIKKAKITIAVVGRLKSTRLPKKALLKLNGITSIERCIINSLAVPYVDEVLVATSFLEADKELENANLSGKIKVIKGDPENVLDRLLTVVEQTEADIILRVTADCPLVSPEAVEILIKEHISRQAEVTLTDLNHAVGIAADVFDSRSLKKLKSQDNEFKYTEYLSFYFKNNPDLFNLEIVSLPKKFRYPNWRLTLDEPQDYKLFQTIYEDLNVQETPVLFEDIIKYFEGNPEIAEINDNILLKWKADQKLIDEINKSTRIKLM